MIAVDNMVLHKSGRRPDLAHKFINFMLEGKNSAELTNQIGAGNPNAEAMKYINPEIAANAAVFPDQQGMKRMEMMRDLDRKQRRVLSRMWIEIKVR